MTFWECFAILEELAPEETTPQAPTPEQHDEAILRFG